MYRAGSDSGATGMLVVQEEGTLGQCCEPEPAGKQKPAVMPSNHLQLCGVQFPHALTIEVSVSKGRVSGS